jgi:hypothetical protein
LVKGNDAITVLQKIQDSENKKAFFDEFARLEQKARLHGRFPDLSNLVRLNLYLETFKETYGEESKYYVTVKRIIETSINRNMEYSISIDGAGRSEFIKSTIRPREDDEDDDKDKDIIEKLADKLG